MIHRLFSYGTLRQPDVQLANFGRLLNGETDALLGYALSTVRIDDPEVVAESGSDMHPILIPDPEAQPVEGMVFEVTPDEIAAADEYETSAYARIEVRLRSGRAAFAYVAA